MSTRKSPPPPTKSKTDEQKQRPSQPSRTPSRANHNKNVHEEEEDDAPPTSSLRGRNVTGTTMLEFPPSSPGSGSGSSVATMPGKLGREWRLPGVKGTMGGIASPSRGSYSSSPVSATWTTSTEVDNTQPKNQKPPLKFRTDPTIKSCLDTIPLESRDEIRRLFGLA